MAIRRASTAHSASEHGSVDDIQPIRPSSISLVPPDSARYPGGDSLLAQSRSLVIASESDYTLAGDLITGTIDPQISVIDADFERPTKLLYESHRLFTSLRAKYKAPFEEARRLLTGARAKYRAQREAEARAEAERVAREAAKQAEIALAEEARSMIAAGEEEEAVAILDEVGKGVDPERFILPQAPIAKTLARVGESVRGLTKFRLRDISKIKREFLVLDERSVKAKLASSKAQASSLADLQRIMDAIVGPGGIEVYEEESESFRRR